MKAKDTVMIIGDWDNKELQAEVQRAIKAQAEITWDIAFKAGHEEGYKLSKNDIEVTHFDVGRLAGRKEVVGFIRHTSMDAHTLVFQVSQKDWQAKLKSWGIE